MFGNRGVMISTASTVVFCVAIGAVVVLAPGFQAVRESFFDVQAMKEAFLGVPQAGIPSIWHAFRRGA